MSGLTWKLSLEVVLAKQGMTEEKGQTWWWRGWGRGGGLGGRAVLLHLVKDTLSIMESQVLWQVKEAVSPPPEPPTVPPPGFVRANNGVQGRLASGLSSSLLPACSPGAHGPLGWYLNVSSLPSALQPSLWEALRGHLLEC